MQLLWVAAQRLQNYVRRTVSHLAAGDMPVLNGDYGTFRVFRAKVMYDDLAIAAKLRSNASSEPLEKVDLLLVHFVSLRGLGFIEVIVAVYMFAVCKADFVSHFDV
jgi:hypothetical protein